MGAALFSIYHITDKPAIAQTISPASTQTIAQASGQTKTGCPSALDRVRSHTVSAGDTVESIATANRLAPSTLIRFNPGLGSSLSPGTTIMVPPFNGAVVEVGNGMSWQALAERYGRRTDVLFEVNGCVADVPNRVFIPGVLGGGRSGGEAIATPSVAQQLRYPLSNPVPVARGYGWQPHTSRNELVFNSGVAFTVPQPNEVIAANAGTVAFTGEREGYGQLVVINHAQGLQTRYANLSSISVSVGQLVNAATPIGSVGLENEPSFLYFEVRTNSESGWVAQDPGQYVPDLDLR